MFLPVQPKPATSPNYTPEVVEVPDLVTRELAEKLKSYALQTDISGLHRRGSKNPYCAASFFTCLILPHNTDIYEILDPAWKYYCDLKNPNISFIENYELKSYIEGDKFEYHHDFLSDSVVSRKVNLMIQLSDDTDYEGGDLIVGPYRCSRKFGTGIFFKAHLSHCVTTITRGTRYSLIGHGWGPDQK